MEAKNHRLLQASLEILEYISKQPKSVPFKEICDISTLPKSSTYNVVQTMSNMGFLHKKENCNEYYIGLKCFEVASSYLSTNPFYSMAKEIVENISLQSNQTSHMGILNGHDTVYIYKFDSNQPLRVASHIGKRIPAHATAIGKALLSDLTPMELRELYRDYPLQALTASTITSIDKLILQEEEIRRTQIAYESEESSPCVSCIAVPIRNRSGRVIAAVSIAFPSYQPALNTDAFHQILLNAKRQLESILLTLDL